VFADVVMADNRWLLPMPGVALLVCESTARLLKVLSTMQQT